jgi:hypothetical protein
MFWALEAQEARGRIHELAFRPRGQGRWPLPPTSAYMSLWLSQVDGYRPFAWQNASNPYQTKYSAVVVIVEECEVVESFVQCGTMTCRANLMSGQRAMITFRFAERTKLDVTIRTDSSSSTIAITARERSDVISSTQVIERIKKG